MSTSTPASPAVAAEGWTFSDFLESCAPEIQVNVVDAIRIAHSVSCVATPDLQLFCGHCKGTRTFTCNQEPSATSQFTTHFLNYFCRNCHNYAKSFALRITREVVPGNTKAEAYKYGEVPPFGPPTPARLISLIGPDRELFLKGRSAEFRGLGIGAFAYYRRVVENQKGRIIEEIEKVSKRLGVRQETLELFAEAKAENQFSSAIEKIKTAIPQSLLIDGHHNPLSILHTALSEGLHAKTDEECLELATSIRAVLAELAERISEALKDEKELLSAVSKLLNRPKPAE